MTMFWKRASASCIKAPALATTERLGCKRVAAELSRLRFRRRVSDMKYTGLAPSIDAATEMRIGTHGEVTCNSGDAAKDPSDAPT